MSFLNPVNEPVLRFSSTDSDAPQINYNARVAGDVKTVLKACLVTGYGDKASAGWSIANEVNHVAEFVSPSVAMSDYRLGIDDTSASSAIWYYRYQDVRIDPNKQSTIKSISNLNSSSSSHKWTLLTTTRSMVLIESFTHSTINGVVSRITHLGQIKNARDSNGENMGFWVMGYAAPETYVYDILTQTEGYDKTHFRVSGFDKFALSTSNMKSFEKTDRKSKNTSKVSLVSSIYLYSYGDFVGEQPACLVKSISKDEPILSANDVVIGDRPALQVCAALYTSSLSDMLSKSVPLLFYTDFWEY